MLLTRPGTTGKAGQAVFDARYRKFVQDDWLTLLQSSKVVTLPKEAKLRERTEKKEWQQIVREAVKRVRLGELSKAAQALVAAKLAPGTMETLQKLTNPERRPRRSLEQIPEQVLNH